MATISPHLHVSNGAAAIEFYKKALGAEELMRMAGPDGKRIMHASLKIGDSVVMLADDFPEMCQEGWPRSPAAIGGTSVTIHVNSADVDKTLATAAAAGGTIVMPAADMFWGDRYGQFKDPFGHMWSVATTKKKMTPEEMREAGQAFLAKGPPKG